MRRELAVAVGTVLCAADVRELRDFAGCYAKLKTAGVALMDVVLNTLAQV